METLKELKSQLNKGSLELKKKAYLSILNKYDDDNKVISYVANRLVKLSSVNLFSDVINSNEAKILPLMDIYMRRIIECKSDTARRGALSFGVFPSDKDTYESTTPWREGDEDIIKSVILNDSNMYVRDDAFGVFINSFGKEYPTQSMYELVDNCISKPYDKGGVFLRTVYYLIPSLPYSQRMYDFIHNKVTQFPIDHEVGTLVTKFQENHPKQFPPLIPVVKKVIDDYIELQSPSFFKKLFGKNSSNNLVQDKDNIGSLANDLLQACETDKEMLLYMQNVADILEDDELYHFVLVKLTYIREYDFDYAEKEIYKVIKNPKKSHYVRLFAVEKLKDFYKNRNVSQPKGSLGKVLDLFNDIDSTLEAEITNTFSPKKRQDTNTQNIEIISDEDCRAFFDAIVIPLTSKEKSLLWKEFIRIYHSNNNDIHAFMNSIIEAQSLLPYERCTLFHIDIKDKDEVEVQINNSIKLLAIPQDIEVYKKSGDYSLQVIDQLKLYALAIKKHNYYIVEIDMGWDDYVAVIIKDTDKTAFNDFMSENVFYENVNYL